MGREMRKGKKNKWGDEKGERKRRDRCEGEGEGEEENILHLAVKLKQLHFRGVVTQTFFKK